MAYAYEPPDGLDPISDCYAMNACGNDVWICYYTDFPLVLIRNGRVESHWEMPVRGADAFAISGDRALFSGSYDHPDTYHLIDLTDLPARVRLRFRLRDRQASHQAGAHDRTGRCPLPAARPEIFKLTVEDTTGLLVKRS